MSTIAAKQKIPSSDKSKDGKKFFLAVPLSLARLPKAYHTV